MTETNSYKFLDRINDARDVRVLQRDNLPELCTEVRDYLINTVSKTSGHFASGLGVVELTVALHYVYNTPQDKLVWDVGHQAYPHKILTGHKKELCTIRQKGGLHAFIWRGETPYDLMTTGHASTSIGSALGLAVAERAKPVKERRKVVAVIGDGALSGGCALEALNHAGSFDDIDLTVILNDNEMSISENVGRLSQGLSHIISSPHYVKLVEGGKRILESLPAVRDLALRAQEHVKGMLVPGTLFEEFGFNYIGPIDGHDVDRLVTILQNIKEMSGLNFLHVVTTKGKGYEPAEKDPICYHGVPVFDPDQGICKGGPKEDLSYSAGFGRWMCDKAATDDKLMAVTPAMRLGSGLGEFAKKYPKQFFDVAIAEQHAMVFASGLAAGGMRPVVNIYSTFMQRAYDGLIHDMAIQNLPIILCLDRGGLVGSDGPTHNGSFDIAYTRAVPNLTIMAPSSRHEQYYMLNTAYALGTPCVIRYPRANGESLMVGQGTARRNEDLSLDKVIPVGQVETKRLASFHLAALTKELNERLAHEPLLGDALAAKINLLGLSHELGDEPLKADTSIAEVLTLISPTSVSADNGENSVEHESKPSEPLGKKHKIALLAYGPFVDIMAPAAKDHDCTLINMRFIKPVNEDLIKSLAYQYDMLVTLEEGAALGGVGEHIAALVASFADEHEGKGLKAQVLTIGLADNFVNEGNRGELLKDQGLDSAGIIAKIAAALAQ